MRGNKNYAHGPHTRGLIFPHLRQKFVLIVGFLQLENMMCRYSSNFQRKYWTCATIKGGQKIWSIGPLILIRFYDSTSRCNRIKVRYFYWANVTVSFKFFLLTDCAAEAAFWDLSLSKLSIAQSSGKFREQHTDPVFGLNFLFLSITIKSNK